MVICWLTFTTISYAQPVDSAGRDLPSRTLLLNEVAIRPGRDIYEEAKDTRQKSLQEMTDKILEYTPGISMIRRGNFAMEPTIRSLNSGQITMTIDGMRVFGACTDKMDPISSYVEPNNLESISVSYDPGANTGGSGLGGGINFRLKEPSFRETPKWSGRIGTGFETNGAAVQTLGGLDYASADLAFQINGIFRRSANYKAAGGKEIGFSQYRKWNGSASVIRSLGRTGILKASYLQDEGHDIGYPALTMDVSFAKAKIAGLSYLYSNQQESIHWETKAYYNSIDHAMDDTNRPPETVNMHMDMPGTSTTFGGFSALDLHLNDQHHMKIKVDGYQNKLLSSMTMYPTEGSPMFMYTLAAPVRRNMGLHVSDVLSFGKRTMLTSSARLEYNHDDVSDKKAKEQLSGMFPGDLTRSNVITNFSIALGFQPDAHWLLNASVARGSRAASLQEAYAFYIYNRLDAYDYLGNPALSGESSVNFSISSSYRNEKIEASGNLFRYFIQDYIAGAILKGYSTMTIGANGVKQYVNLPSAKLYGGELAFKWKAGGGLVITSLNSFTRGSDGDGLALPLIAPLKTVNTIDYNLDKTILRIEGITNTTQKHVSTQRYGETATPASTILNFYIGKEFKVSSLQALKINLGIDNILDEYYFQHLDIQKVARPGRNLTYRMAVLF